MHSEPEDFGRPQWLAPQGDRTTRVLLSDRADGPGAAWPEPTTAYGGPRTPGGPGDPEVGFGSIGTMGSGGGSIDRSLLVLAAAILSAAVVGGAIWFLSGTGGETAAGDEAGLADAELTVSPGGPSLQPSSDGGAGVGAAGSIDGRIEGDGSTSDPTEVTAGDEATGGSSAAPGSRPTIVAEVPAGDGSAEVAGAEVSTSPIPTSVSDEDPNPAGGGTSTPATEAGATGEPPSTTGSTATTAAPRSTTTVAPTSSAPAQASTTAAAPPPPGVDDATMQQAILDLTNVERAKAGCGPLRLDPVLNGVADGHSEDMLARKYFAHTDPDGEGPGDRIAASGYPYRGWGENIAVGYRAAEAVMEGWMDSDGHRRNIVNCAFDELGVGYAEGGSWGRYWTQVFATRR